MSLHKTQWEEATALTQYMREGSSHEMCYLLFTEIIVHSSRNLKKPVVVSFLDTKAAFDSARKEYVIREIFEAANFIPSQSIIYMAHRLASQWTFLNHESTVMGPMLDGWGLNRGEWDLVTCFNSPPIKRSKP